jgi:hypothetical protein
MANSAGSASNAVMRASGSGGKNRLARPTLAPQSRNARRGDALLNASVRLTKMSSHCGQNDSRSE